MSSKSFLFYTMAVMFAAVVWQPRSFAQECAGPTKLVVGLPAGGGNDAVARLVASYVSNHFNRSIIVDNKPGAAGNIAAEYVARAPHDGCTIAVRSGEHNINPLIYPRAGYAVSDFAPVVLLTRGPGVIVASPTQPFKTLAAMVDYAKRHPGSVSYGSSGVGGANHIAMELLIRAAGVDLLHVPYKGAALAIQDLISGNVSLSVGSVASVMPYIASGRVIPLAVTGLTRWPTLPNVPTIGESGYADATIMYWIGLLVPRGTPNQAINKLNQEFGAAVADPTVKSKLLAFGFEPAAGSSSDFDTFLQDDYRKMRLLQQHLNLKVE